MQLAVGNAALSSYTNIRYVKAMWNRTVSRFQQQHLNIDTDVNIQS